MTNFICFKDRRYKNLDTLTFIHTPVLFTRRVRLPRSRRFLCTHHGIYTISTRRSISQSMRECLLDYELKKVSYLSLNSIFLVFNIGFFLVYLGVSPYNEDKSGVDKSLIILYEKVSTESVDAKLDCQHSISVIQRKNQTK